MNEKADEIQRSRYREVMGNLNFFGYETIQAIPTEHLDSNRHYISLIEELCGKLAKFD